MTNSERAAKAVYHLVAEIEQRKSQGDRFGPAVYTERIASTIRHEITGVDELDALRRRVAVLEKSIRLAADQYMGCGGNLKDHEVIASMRQILEAALSASPPAPPDPNAEIVRRLETLVKETEWVRWDDPECGAGGELCPTCGAEKTHGHKEGCERAACIADAAALRAGQPNPNPDADQTKQDVFSRQMDVLDGKVTENPLPNPMHTRY